MNILRNEYLWRPNMVNYGFNVIFNIQFQILESFLKVSSKFLQLTQQPSTKLFKYWITLKLAQIMKISRNKRFWDQNVTYFRDRHQKTLPHKYLINMFLTTDIPSFWDLRTRTHHYIVYIPSTIPYIRYFIPTWLFLFIPVDYIFNWHK